jgi:hypothetical protein
MQGRCTSDSSGRNRADDLVDWCAATARRARAGAEVLHRHVAVGGFESCPVPPEGAYCTDVLSLLIFVLLAESPSFSNADRSAAQDAFARLARRLRFVRSAR